MGEHGRTNLSPIQWLLREANEIAFADACFDGACSGKERIPYCLTRSEVKIRILHAEMNSTLSRMYQSDRFSVSDE